MHGASSALPFSLQTILLLVASNVLKEPLKLDYLWAALCMVGSVYFIFRNG